MIDRLRTEHQVSIGLNIRSNGIKPHPQAHKKQLVEQLKQLWPEVTFYLYEGQPEYNEENYPQSHWCRILHRLQKSFARKHRRAYAQWSAKHESGDMARAKSVLDGQFTQYNPGFLKFVEDISRRGFDVVQAEMYEYLFLVYFFPCNVKRIFIHHELRFVRIQNELSLFRQQNGNDILTYEQIKATEISALQAYDQVVTLTEHDKTILSQYIDAKKLITSPAAIMMPDKKYEFRAGRDFVFVGSGDHEPNADGLRWFVDKILPVLKERQEEIKLYVVGKWNKKQRLPYKNIPEITFTGFVDDLAQFINGKISIVPIRMGSGMRIKIIEAINAMSPFITTVKGVEGLNFQAESECLITNDAAEFAHYMLKLQNDVNQQQTLTLNAYNKVSAEYNMEHLYALRNQIYL